MIYVLMGKSVTIIYPHNRAPPPPHQRIILNNKLYDFSVILSKYYLYLILIIQRLNIMLVFHTFAFHHSECQKKSKCSLIIF